MRQLSQLLTVFTAQRGALFGCVDPPAIALRGIRTPYQTLLYCYTTVVLCGTRPSHAVTTYFEYSFYNLEFPFMEKRNEQASQAGLEPRTSTENVHRNILKSVFPLVFLAQVAPASTSLVKISTRHYYRRPITCKSWLGFLWLKCFPSDVSTPLLSSILIAQGMHHQPQTA